RSIFESLGSLRASVTIHDAMTQRVLRAPIGWFEKTPLGRIFNRFSSDINEIDKDLMETFGSTLACFFNAAAIVVVISYTIPWLVLFLLPISGLAYYIGALYLNCSRELKRLDSVSKSPIYAHFTESVAGVSTVRAFGAQERFVAESSRRVDRCNRAHFNLWVSNRWFNIRIQAIGALVSGLSGAFLVWWGKDHLSPALAGLSLLYALQFTNALKYVVRQHAQLEMEMNSVERTLEYQALPQEADPQVRLADQPPPDWPRQGGITFDGVTLQYPSASAPVIENMSFVIEPQTRVGIVGRTGAGKSSLTTCLFRLVEPAAGRIIIDGIDTLAVGLEVLRSRLAIVPQDPVLFRGTVRSNLDPFGEYSDADMWEALRRAHLASSVTADGGLDSQVEDNGSNFSVGQRQLLCMARALLRNSSILVMDEATANVDPETDIIIQSTMRHEFRGSTVLCVAHRLHTIIFYDKVMVLERGRLEEYAAPIDLLNDEASLFHALCAKTGSLDELKATAAEEAQMRAASAAGAGGAATGAAGGAA
ncbi:unnamed protein product, partial [Phaeothamnion confervicola]